MTRRRCSTDSSFRTHAAAPARIAATIRSGWEAALTMTTRD
jgi:hypothetical protein